MYEMVQCVLVIDLFILQVLQVFIIFKIILYVDSYSFLALSATATTTQQSLCVGQNGAIHIYATGGNGGNMYSVCI